VWKSKFYGALVLNHRVVLHAIDATPARRRGDVAPDALVDFHTAIDGPHQTLAARAFDGLELAAPFD
jgi:hypothetical protein